jgi:hypothetical protein
MALEGVVWKYAAAPGGFVVEMPKGAEVVSVGLQDPDIRFAPVGDIGKVFVFWACVDPNAPLVNRKFRTVGTGHSYFIEDEAGKQEQYKFVGTVQFPNGLVFHLFDLGEV